MTFHDLNEASITRCKAAFPCDDWTLSDWATALAGEVGEACNLIKKMRRGDPGITTQAIADELADAAIYIDLLCWRLGESMEVSIVRKFNEVSKRRNYPIMLAAEKSK